MTGKLFLLPNLLDPKTDPKTFFPISVDQAVANLHGLIAESEKEARLYLKRFGRHLPIRTLNEHTHQRDIDDLIEQMKQGQIWGFVSDAGLPCLADPGYQLVSLAHKFSIPVQALTGPSSLIFALMLSGLPAQQFAFHGYLPREPEPLKRALLDLEKRSRVEKSVQLFIEAPYRNLKTFETIIQTLSPQTQLCLASDLTAPTEMVKTQAISAWKKGPPPEIDKHPTVFLFLA